MRSESKLNELHDIIENVRHNFFQSTILDYYDLARLIKCADLFLKSQRHFCVESIHISPDALEKLKVILDMKSSEADMLIAFNEFFSTLKSENQSKPFTKFRSLANEVEPFSFSKVEELNWEPRFVLPNNGLPSKLPSFWSMSSLENQKRMSDPLIQNPVSELCLTISRLSE